MKTNVHKINLTFKILYLQKKETKHDLIQFGFETRYQSQFRNYEEKFEFFLQFSRRGIYEQRKKTHNLFFELTNERKIN